MINEHGSRTLQEARSWGTAAAQPRVPEDLRHRDRPDPRRPAGGHPRRAGDGRGLAGLGRAAHLRTHGIEEATAALTHAHHRAAPGPTHLMPAPRGSARAPHPHRGGRAAGRALHDGLPLPAHRAARGHQARHRVARPSRGRGPVRGPGRGRRERKVGADSTAGSTADRDRVRRPKRAPAPGPRRRTDWAGRCVRSGWSTGTRAGAWSVIENAMAAGMAIEEVYLELLTPALRSVGDRWETGEITVADEHVASADHAAPDRPTRAPVLAAGPQARHGRDRRAGRRDPQPADRPVRGPAPRARLPGARPRRRRARRLAGVDRGRDRQPRSRCASAAPPPGNEAGVVDADRRRAGSDGPRSSWSAGGRSPARTGHGRSAPTGWDPHAGSARPDRAPPPRRRSGTQPAEPGLAEPAPVIQIGRQLRSSDVEPLVLNCGRRPTTPPSTEPTGLRRRLDREVAMFTGSAETSPGPTSPPPGSGSSTG